MRCNYMVCDGVPKAYTAVWDIYGCCDDCKMSFRMDRRSNACKEWIKTFTYITWKKRYEE